MIYGILIVFILFNICFYLSSRKSILLSNRGKLYDNAQEENENKKIFLFSTFFMLALIMGLRNYTVGRDTPTYKIIFEDLMHFPAWDILTDKVNSFEKGFAMLMRLSGEIYPSYYFFQMVVAFLYCFGMSKFIYDNFEDILTPFIIFLALMYFQAFNGTRQWFAVMITANSWTCLKNKRFFSSLFLSFLAISMHKTAILFFIAYVIYFVNNKKIFLQIIPVSMVVMAIFYKQILQIIADLGLYDIYMNNSQDRLPLGWSFLMWLILLAVAIFEIYCLKKTQPIERAEAVMSCWYNIAGILGLFFNYFDRTGWFFVPFIMLTIVSTEKYLLKNLQSIYLWGSRLCFFIFFILNMTGVSELAYSFFW